MGQWVHDGVPKLAMLSLLTRHWVHWWLHRLITSQFLWLLITLLEKKVVTTPFEAIKSIWICTSSGLKLTWNVPVTAPQQNPTLPSQDFYFNAKWDRQSPKLQLRWSFPQICLRTVANSNQQLHIFSHFSLIVLIIPHPTHIVIRHEVLALACEGMRQSAIAGHMDLTRATIIHILQRRAATGTFMPDHALFRIVQQDRSGLDGVDEEFVWNEGWPENHQQLAIIPWLPCL